MATSLMVAAFLVCISCALAENSSTIMVAPTLTHMASAAPVTTTAPMTTAAPQPSPSSSLQTSSSTSSASPAPSPPMMTSASPMPSPSPAPPLIPENNYVYPSTGPVCIRLEARIETSVTYETTNNRTNTSILVVNGNARVHSGFCNETYAELTLAWDNNQNNLTFTFSATNTGWTEQGVTFQYALTDENTFPDYIGGYNLGVAMFTDTLLKDRESNLNNQSFLCNATQTFHTNETNTGNTTRATLIVRDLQMQAFSFSNSTSGAFDEAYNCATNESTNKIVPIVVGAALAGLVIVVLIAYLIGRFRNRKQSSYEALS